VTSIPDLLALHKKKCGLAEEAMVQFRLRQRPLRPENMKALKNYEILLLCRAIMVVLDRAAPQYEVDRITSATYKRISYQAQ
jgi:hypothetical protein